jgi:DNA-binding transcriptional LysR family regulator
MGQEAIQMQTIISLVSAELGIALVPHSLRSLARSGVSYLPLAGEPPRLETGLIWRRDDRSPALQHFVRMATAAVPDGERDGNNPA